ncbi:amidase [Brenneria goodwinii]|uniref:Amidase n=1 Tax=Brenneria goodwinii TaxID=1109412 RepID=A0AAE8EN46_9GAMM|nr:amidase [Brenneria goodwinii]RLM22054.1 amidase [Brenneria goodwinii]
MLSYSTNNISHDEAAGIVDLSALALAERIRTATLSCREVMEAYLAHIDRFNPRINAIVSRVESAELLAQADRCDAELAQGHYRGILHGMPQAPKDLAAVKGMVTSMGSPIFKHQVPARDGLSIERIRAAGAIFIGRTNTSEFGLGSHSYNSVHGVTRNPWDPDRSAGGSSGGAGAALAARMLPVADGSDMMGSLRNPAAFNNVFGMRPSQGRVPYGLGGELFFQQLSTEGAMARTIPDVAMMLQLISGPDPRIPLSLRSKPEDFSLSLTRDVSGVRIGWLGDLDGYLPMERDVLTTCAEALTTFADIGCRVSAAALSMSAEELWNSWVTLRSFLISGNLAACYDDKDKRALLKPEAIWEIEQGLALSSRDIYRASVIRSAWYRRLLDMFTQYDFLAIPSSQVAPFPVEQHWPSQIGDRQMDTYHRWMEVVILASLAGAPALSVPAGFTAAGLPVGLQIIGPPQADFSVLQLGQAYDRASGWSQRKPVLSDH